MSPLTAAEQNKIIQLLGYAGKSLQAGSVLYDKVMNDRLHNLPPVTVELVRSYLAQVAVIETQLFQAPVRLVATKVQDIELNHREMIQLRSERRRISREISTHVDIPYIGTNGVNVGVVA
jgi:hypothetical protein